MAASVIAPMLSKLGTKQSTVDQLNDAASVLCTLSNNKKLANIYLEAGAVQASIKFMKTHSMRKFSISYENLLLLLARIGSSSAKGGAELIKRGVFDAVIKSIRDKNTNRRIRTNGILILLGIAVWQENRLATCSSRVLEAVYQAMSRAQSMLMKRPVSQPSRDMNFDSNGKQVDLNDINSSGKGNELVLRPSTVDPLHGDRSLEKNENNSGLLGWACCLFLWYAASHTSCRLPIVRAGLLKPLIFFTEHQTVDIIEEFEKQEDIKYQEELFVLAHKNTVRGYAASKARFPAAGALWQLARDGLCRSVIVELKGIDGLLYLLEDVVLSDPTERTSIIERFDSPEKSKLHDEILYLNADKKK